MKIDKEEAMALKLAVKRLFDTQEGQLLMEYLAEVCGDYVPTYIPTEQTTITLEAGRRQILAILRNFNRLTVEQVIEACRKGQS